MTIDKCVLKVCHIKFCLGVWYGFSETDNGLLPSLFGAKPLFKPMLGYCQLDVYEQTAVKF